MVEFVTKTLSKLFGAQLDFRVRLFNILATTGAVISLITGVSGIFTKAGLDNFIFCMAAMIIAVTLLWYSFISGKYKLCYIITVIFIFLGIFPALFFSAGGYYSGMPSFFIFAVLVTVFMLDGKKMIIMVILELAVYISICIYAYHNPDTVNFFNKEADVLADVIFGFVIVSIALGIIMVLHFKLYEQRHRELEAARKHMEEYSKMKSELFAGMSHEMRTPLTVMSAYAQFAVEQIRESGANEQTLADLATISVEAKRLAEMAGGTLKILMDASETSDTGLKKNLPVDMGTLSTRLVRLLEPIASRKGKKMSAMIRKNIPEIYGDVDALTQLLWNILQNAITHSDGKNIDVIAERCFVSNGNPNACSADNSFGVKVTVCDDGIGIEPEILPRIFEHGVSGKEGGSGLGLSICRDIARRHNGDVSIESKAGNTIVTILLHNALGGINA